jgi:hypothetical protein
MMMMLLLLLMMIMMMIIIIIILGVLETREESESGEGGLHLART